MSDQSISASPALDLQGPRRIPVGLNVALVTGIGAVQLAFLFAPALWVDRGWFTVAALALFGLSAYALWGLIHESVHGLLHPNRHVNRDLGRILSIIHGCPLLLVRAEHLLHHRYNRVEDFADTYDPKRTTWGKEVLGHCLFIVCGFYTLVQVLGNLMVWLPAGRRTRLILEKMPGPKYSAQFNAILNNHIGEARLDACAVFALYAASIWVFRDSLAMFAALYLVRAFIISVMDYAYHYGTPRNEPDDPDPAKNLACPASWLILNFNYHAVHHANPSVSWRWLPAVAKAQQAVLHEPILAAVLKQFAGPIPADGLPRHDPALSVKHTQRHGVRR